jgi:predicted RND superfamily exporter protein
LDPIFRFISKHPWLVLALLIAVTLLASARLLDFGTGRVRIEIDMSTNRLLPEEDENKTFYDFVRKVFGSDETLLVAMHAPNIFTQDNLERVSRMTTRLEGVDGVHHVVSLTNALHIRGTEDSLDIRPLVSEIPEEPEALAEMREEALGNPLYAGSLISKDGRTTSLLVYFLDFSDREFIERGLDERVQAIAREEAGEAELWFSGGPHLKVAQIEYQLRGLMRMLPLILVVLGIVLAFSFRTVRGVAIPLLTVVTSLLWAMGAAAWIGRPLNLVTILIPPLLLILGLSYSVHVVSEFYDTLREKPVDSGADAARGALNRVWLPVALTGFTTAAGFMALALSPMSAIREFGILSMIGVLLTVLASLSIPPVLLALLPKPRRIRDAAVDGPFERFVERVAEFDLKRRRAIFIAAAATGLLAVAAFPFIKIGSNSIENFPKDSSIRGDFEAINSHLGGANAFNVVLEASEADAFIEPVNLRAVEDLQVWLEEQPEIGGTTSVVDYLKLINRGFHDNDPEYFAIPETRRAAGRLLFFGSSDDLDGFVDRTYRLANLTVRANIVDHELLGALIARIESRLAGLGESLDGKVTGNPVLLNRLADDIVRGQAYSIAGALILIYAILAMLFLDFRTGLIALIPNVLPVAVYFGALGITGVTLNFATTLIAPMALGIAIDDTIHYFTRFNRDAKRFADERRGTITALRSVGRPVTYTSIAVCTGFLVLMTSDLRNQVQLGALAAFTLGFAWLVDFTLTPALCSSLRVVTLWDSLTLDLGEEPQESIPLFQGLTKTQCRIVALMASMHEVPTGRRLMSAGEIGREMYVIIEGALKITTRGDREAIELATNRRGDVVGEVGLFYKTRSANADVIEDARLLRLTQSNMSRLSRRFPRIAARVLGNLNQILAERLSQTTGKLR